MSSHTEVECPLFSDLSTYVRRAKLEGFVTSEGTSYADDFVTVRMHNGRTGATLTVTWDSES